MIRRPPRPFREPAPSVRGTWCPAGGSSGCDQRGHRRGAASLVVAGHPSRLDQDLFLPTPEKIFSAFVSAMNRRHPGRKALPETFHVEHDPRLLGVLPVVPMAVPVGIAMACRASRAAFSIRRSSSTSAAAAACLPAADRDLVWHRRDREDLLIYLACFAPLAMAARARHEVGHQEQRSMRASLNGGVEMAGDAARHRAGSVAGNPHRHAHRHRLRLDYAGGCRDGGGERGLGQMVLNASNFLRTDIVIMGIGVVAYLSRSGWMRRISSGHGAAERIGFAGDGRRRLSTQMARTSSNR